MIGKYINQFMADNELLVNEEFFIKNMVKKLICGVKYVLTT